MTIRNGAELEGAREALSHLRAALASLERDVGSLNARNFAIMAEGTVDEIARIEADVDAYLAVDRG